MIKLIIFDMDGLMIDSEPFHRKAFNKVFQEYGKELTEEDNSKYYIGISDIDAVEDMIKRFSLPLSPEELVERKQTAYKKLVASHIIPQNGLLNLLKNLQKNGYKKVIASCSMFNEIELIINNLKINKYINGYFSAEQVENGKPAPDLFLFAAEKMRTLPKDCLVLEDAPSGINAAKVAGMKSFAIPSKETKGKDFSKATKVLDNLNEVYDNLKNL
ncbi:MAG: HAD family phosphatase [Candidatus Gottesmanbacteria bacterium]